jgi:hypothetical protein
MTEYKQPPLITPAFLRVPIQARQYRRTKKVTRMANQEDRYYVQRLTDQVILVRERTSPEGEHGPDDRIVRSFDVRHDAYTYAESMNEKQRTLDEQYGRWAQLA